MLNFCYNAKGGRQLNNPFAHCHFEIRKRHLTFKPIFRNLKTLQFLNDFLMYCTFLCQKGYPYVKFCSLGSGSAILVLSSHECLLNHKNPLKIREQNAFSPPPPASGSVLAVFYSYLTIKHFNY
jgi:hypothetical protein